MNGVLSLWKVPLSCTQIKNNLKLYSKCIRQDDINKHTHALKSCMWEQMLQRVTLIFSSSHHKDEKNITDTQFH